MKYKRFIRDLIAKKVELQTELSMYVELPYNFSGLWPRLVATIDYLAERGALPRKKGRDKEAARLFLKDGEPLNVKYVSVVRTRMTGDDEYDGRDSFALSTKERDLADAIAKAVENTATTSNY